MKLTLYLQSLGLEGHGCHLVNIRAHGASRNIASRCLKYSALVTIFPDIPRLRKGQQASLVLDLKLEHSYHPNRRISFTLLDTQNEQSRIAALAVFSTLHGESLTIPVCSDVLDILLPLKGYKGWLLSSVPRCPLYFSVKSYTSHHRGGPRT